jgi:hypothetical protein
MRRTGWRYVSTMRTTQGPGPRGSTDEIVIVVIIVIDTIVDNYRRRWWRCWSSPTARAADSRGEVAVALTLIIWAWSRSIVMFWSGLGLANRAPTNTNVKLVVVIVIGINRYTTFSFSRSPGRFWIADWKRRVTPSSNTDVELVIVVIIGTGCYPTFSFSRSPARRNSNIDFILIIITSTAFSTFRPPSGLVVRCVVRG